MKKTAKTGTVTDEQGRVRFHGAFTGGFSAGYYNTVGSSEGFQPAQFVSSRTNRASQPSGRSIADYMDEGDGLLGGKLSSVAGIDSFSRSGTEGIDQQRALEANSSILNKQLLSELTVQAKPSDTIGKTLLATMGWRLGQGIGPRTSKKRVDYFSQNSKVLTMEVHPGADLSKLPSSALLKNGAVTFAPDDEGQKILFPPPKVDMYGLGFDPRLSGRLGVSSEGTDFSIDPEDDAYECAGNTYRMSDVIKSSTRGGGAAGSAHDTKRAAYGQQTQPAKRLKYTSGFAYNDEEDDVYSHDKPLALTNSIEVSDDTGHQSLVTFDPTSGPERLQNASKRKEFAHNVQETLSNINQGVENWLGGGSSLADGSRLSDFSTSAHVQGDFSHTLNSVERCPSDNRPPLAGFHVARRPRVPPPHYPPPVVPEDFHCHHSFEQGSENSSAVGNVPQGVRRQNPLDAAKARSEKMSDKTETSTTGVNEGISAPTEAKKVSIFDLIKPEARLKLQNTINSVNPGSQVQIAPVAAPPLPPLPPLPPTPPPPPPETINTTTSTSTTSTANNKDALPAAPPARPMLTSSLHLNSTFAGLAQAFKNRFASATTTEGAGTKDSVVLEGMATASEYTQKLAEKASLQAFEALKSAQNAPKMITLKGSTRTVTAWAPAPLLCKRMNIRMPDISKTSAQLGAQAEISSGVDVVSQLLGANARAEAPILQFGRAPDTTSVEVQREQEEARQAEAAKLDVYQAPVVAKPDISVFKSIFEDSDSEEEDNEEEGEEEGRGEGGNEVVSRQNQPLPAQIPPKIAKTSEKEGPMEEEETGPVRFVPSKLRTTIAGRNASSGVGGVGGVGGGGKARGTMRARTSFDDPDEAEVGDIVLTRQVRPRLTSATDVTNASKNSGGKAQERREGGEESEEEAVFVAVGGSSRAASQNTVSFGGGGLGARARKGRVVAGSLRERLLAQQREEEEDGEGGVEGGKVGGEGVSAGGARPVNSAAKPAGKAVRPEDTSSSDKVPSTVSAKNSHPETNVLHTTASTTSNSSTAAVPRVTAIQSVINTSAADDFLADLSVNLLSAPVLVPPVVSSAVPSVEGVGFGGGGERTSVPAAPRANSRFGSVAVAVPAAHVTDGAPHPSQGRTAPAPAEAASRDARDECGYQNRQQSASAAADYFVPLPPPPPPLPAQPAPPALQAPGEAPLMQVSHSPVRSSAAPGPFPAPEMVLPPEPRFESSIQRLSALLSTETDQMKASKEPKCKKDSRELKESKKAHKSHKSDKHKHKKDKKDRKRDRKDSKKGKKRRHNESSESESDGSGSSSDSD